ncbi:MAG: hypothetical protein ACTHLX_19830 [Candidatus Binatia bacterium]
MVSESLKSINSYAALRGWTDGNPGRDVVVDAAGADMTFVQPETPAHSAIGSDMPLLRERARRAAE